VIDRLHFEAFPDSGLANSKFAPHWAAETITNQKIHRHISDFFYPGDRMTIVGLGIDHATLVKALTPLFSNPTLSGNYYELKNAQPLPSEPKPGNPSYAEKPSLVRLPADGDTQLAIGFRGEGRGHARDRAALLAFQEVLGGGPVDPFIPGRLDNRGGRFARNVLEKNSFISQAYAFHKCYSDAGLFGIYSEAAAGNGAALIKAVLNEARAAASDLTGEDVQRAKNVLKGKSARKAPIRRALADQIAYSTISGAPTTPAEFQLIVESLSLEEIKKAAQAALSSPPVIVAHGDVRGIKL